MKNRIGFLPEEPLPEEIYPDERENLSEPRKSLADIYFPGDGRTLTYYNDQFNLKVGDLVFVDGKLEGRSGRVRHLTYQFKIRPDAYQKVIAVADTQVHGQLFFAGSHFVTFDRQTLPQQQVAAWFFPPGRTFITGGDGTGFSLEDISQMPFSQAIAQRGHEYYMENRVAYLCLDGERGYGVVQGEKPYEVEFQYTEGMIRDMTCTCPCSACCKHEFALLLQLKETLGNIEKSYSQQAGDLHYFAAVSRDTLEAYVLSTMHVGSIIL